VQQPIDGDCRVPRAAAVIPTYNNAATVAEVVAGVRAVIADVYVVNDGSIDGTADTLRSMIAGPFSGSAVHLIEFPRNRGKGAALKAGLEAALADGFTHAITLDADGQHRPEDAALFLDKIQSDPSALWIGERVVPYKGSKQPLRCRAGRAFGAFWYRFFTDKNIRDTQCGFRAYPLRETLGLGCAGERFEFEQEALIRAAWSGIPVKSIPIHLYYPLKAKAVSHFRPFKDFIRIAKVNSKAALIKIFMPWRTVGVSGKGWRQNLLLLVSAAGSPAKAARSLAMGVFMGIMPVYGFQVLLLAALTPVMRLNWPLAFLGVNVSTVPVLPLIIAAAIAIGRVIVPLLPHVPDSGTHSLARGGIEWFVGSIALALAAAALTYAMSYPAFAVIRRKYGKI
jgi:glycosyltransferase involved in cell wall biosynthesis